jgi:diguanylate cyclase
VLEVRAQDRSTDVPTDFPHSQAARDLNLRSYATSPVVLADGTVYGTLCLASSERIPTSDDTLALLSLYGRIIADHLDRAPAAA